MYKQLEPKWQNENEKTQKSTPNTISQKQNNKTKWYFSEMKSNWVNITKINRFKWTKLINNVDQFEMNQVLKTNA